MFQDPPPTSRVYHHVDTEDASPLHCKVRPFLDEKLAAPKAAFAEMEAAGVICHSSSPWSSPLHMVRKKNGGWRPCSHYRHLNLMTVSDRYPIPLISDAQTNIAGCKVFSVVDSKSGYKQIPMEPGCQNRCHYTFGLFEWTKMPFGL